MIRQHQLLFATSQALQQHVAYQTKTSNSLPTTSVVTISNQTGPLVTSTVALNQASAQLQQQQLIAATIAASQQQQQHQQQQQLQQQQHLVAVAQQHQQQQTVMPPPSSPAQNPILAMASMMNAAAGGNITGNTSLTTAVAMTSPMGNTTATNVSSLPATPTKIVTEQLKTVSSAPSTPSTVTINVNTATSAPTNPVQLTTVDHQQSKETPTKSNEVSTTILTTTTCTISTTPTIISTNNCSATQQFQQLSPTLTAINHTTITPTETPQMAVQPTDTTETVNDPPTPLATKQPNSIALATTAQTTESINGSPSKTLKSSNIIPQQSGVSNESEKSPTQIVAAVSSSPEDKMSSSNLNDISTSSATSYTTSITTTSSTTNTSNTFSTSTTTSITTSSTPVAPKSTGPPPKSTPGATIVKVEKDLPKAMIKPNVLTHVIDGFIIQEANEPFPVTRKRYTTDKDDNDEIPEKKQALDDGTTNNTNHLSTSPLPVDMVACEQCGKAEHKTKLKKKRFCSPACARQAKASVGEQVSQVQQQHQQQQHQQQQQQQHTQQQQQQQQHVENLNNSNESNNNSHLNNNVNMELNNSLATATMATAAVGILDRMQTDNSTIMHNLPIVTPVTQLQIPQIVPPTLASANTTVVNEAAPLNPVVAAPAASAIEQQPQMANWTVSDVCEFIKNLPGCSDYVDDFEQQEIDGQALLLLKENHLVNAMGMKLGPALKIVAKVESMKEVTAAAYNAVNNAIEATNANSQ